MKDNIAVNKTQMILQPHLDVGVRERRVAQTMPKGKLGGYVVRLVVAVADLKLLCVVRVERVVGGDAGVLCLSEVDL